VAAALVAGCGTSTPNDCSVPAVVDDYLRSADIDVIDDCGYPQTDGLSGIDMAAWQGAASCALDHAMQQHPFRVRWMAQGIEGPTRGAYVGVPVDGVWTLAAFGQSAQPDAVVPPAVRDACSALQSMSPCGSIETTMCIECVDRAVADHCMP
jgi:hypothetical protein